MEKGEKLREHITISEDNGVTFFQIVTVFSKCIAEILDDDLIAFAFINEQGLMVGSENLYPVEKYIYDEGTLFRAFTERTRWRLSAIRRGTSGPVTFIEIVAPIDTADRLKEVADFIIDNLRGTRVKVG